MNANELDILNKWNSFKKEYSNTYNFCLHLINNKNFLSTISIIPNLETSSEISKKYNEIGFNLYNFKIDKVLTDCIELKKSQKEINILTNKYDLFGSFVQALNLELLCTPTNINIDYSFVNKLISHVIGEKIETINIIEEKFNLINNLEKKEIHQLNNKNKI